MNPSTTPKNDFFKNLNVNAQIFNLRV